VIHIVPSSARRHPADIQPLYHEVLSMAKKTEPDEFNARFASFSEELTRVLNDFPELKEDFRVFVSPRRKASLEKLALAEAEKDHCKGKCKKGQKCEFEAISGRWVCRP
jgi:hypothetical protein